MGWNTAFVLIEKLSISEIEPILPDVFYLTDETLTWEEASASALAPNLAIGVCNNWAIIYDPHGKFALNESILSTLSHDAQILACILSSVATYYGFHYFVAGQCRRKHFRENEAVIADDGEPLTIERALSWSDQEDAVIEIARHITGIAMTNAEHFSTIPFKLIELDL